MTEAGSPGATGRVREALGSVPAGTLSKGLLAAGGVGAATVLGGPVGLFAGAGYLSGELGQQMNRLRKGEESRYHHEPETRLGTAANVVAGVTAVGATAALATVTMGGSSLVGSALAGSLTTSTVTTALGAFAAADVVRSSVLTAENYRSTDDGEGSEATDREVDREVGRDRGREGRSNDLTRARDGTGVTTVQPSESVNRKLLDKSLGERYFFGGVDEEGRSDFIDALHAASGELGREPDRRSDLREQFTRLFDGDDSVLTGPNGVGEEAFDEWARDLERVTDDTIDRGVIERFRDGLAGRRDVDPVGATLDLAAQAQSEMSEAVEESIFGVFYDDFAGRGDLATARDLLDVKEVTLGGVQPVRERLATEEDVDPAEIDDYVLSERDPLDRSGQTAERGDSRNEVTDNPFGKSGQITTEARERSEAEENTGQEPDERTNGLDGSDVWE